MIYISNLVSRRCRTSSRFAAALISSSVLLFSASLALSGCASSQEEQRYSWPLATASPEDTVTQLFAEKFAEEVHDLSNGAMRIQVYDVRAPRGTAARCFKALWYQRAF